ncbi:hypothetical protein ACFWVC_31560 [Streptomyces sp. NPDC058691]|uniref:hypothetical protein n=1 Tax=Streptomyces sp. NPDC058691 TaxID=3346601 RepID=UPI003666C414
MTKVTDMAPGAGAGAGVAADATEAEARGTSAPAAETDAGEMASSAAAVHAAVSARL